MKIKPLQHGDQLIPYEIHHKATVTRRIHLRVAADGSLMVIAPRRMSKRLIHQSLQQRADKVARFLSDAVTRQQELPGNSFIDGEAHLFLGQLYPLQFRAADGSRDRIDLAHGHIRVTASDHSPQIIEKRLTTWYAQQAARHFSARLEAIAAQASWTAHKTPPLRLRKMKRTWGSCAASGVITLNKKLIKAPANCIDYVIAHELCHLREMNHGRAFYALQEELYPNWRPARAHLRDQAHIYLG